MNASLEVFRARRAFNAPTRMRTWKKLAAQSKHAVSIRDSLSFLKDQAAAQRSSLALVFEDVLSRMGSGHELGTALTGYASPEEILLISSGQKAGKVEEGLLLAVDMLQARRKIVMAILKAIAHPLLLFVVIIVMMLIVSLQAMPQIAALADPRKWTGLAKALYLFSAFVSSWAGIASGILILGMIVLILVSLPCWTGPARRVADKAPPWSIYRLMVGSVWLFTLATLMRSGRQQSQILDMMAVEEHTTPYLRQRVQAINVHIVAGKNLGEAMYESGMGFPDAMLIDDFCIYARLPGFHDRLYGIAKDWMDEGIERIQRNAQLMNTCLLVFFIGLVVFIALSVYDAQTQITGGLQ